MSSTVLHKQFVTDEDGNHIGVIIPIADYLAIEPLLQKRERLVRATKRQRRDQLLRTAEIMQKEYAKDKDLTAFTALDGEDFTE